MTAGGGPFGRCPHQITAESPRGAFFFRLWRRANRVPDLHWDRPKVRLRPVLKLPKSLRWLPGRGRGLCFASPPLDWRASIQSRCRALAIVDALINHWFTVDL
jgi:hypothetical protein